MSIAAGSACLEITPEKPCTLAGYAGRDHASEGIHDPLRLRALFLEGARDSRALIISADILWFGPKISDDIRSRIEAELGVPPANTFLAATHTHSAPNARDTEANGEWLKALPDRALAAAALARTRLEPVRMRVHRGASRIGINRREWRDGRVVLGHNPKGVIDREITIISLEGKSRRPVARLINFGCHGVVMGGGNYLISGDWPGVAAAMLEKKHKCPVLFCNGGAGNINSRVGPQNAFEPMEELAAEFAKDCCKALKKKGKSPSETGLSAIEVPLELPHKQKNVEAGKGRFASVQLHGMRIGDVCLVGYPGEMFCETAMAVKDAAASVTLVCSYIDDGNRGYVPVREAYDTGGYEVGSSPYTDDAEAVLRQGLIDLCARL